MVSQEFVKEVQVDYRKRFTKNVRQLLIEEIDRYFVPELLKVFASWEGIYFSGEIGKKDPTNFANSSNSQAIANEVKKQLTKSFSTFNIGQENDIVLLSSEFIGEGGSVSNTDPSPIKWLTYFINGSFDTPLYFVTDREMKILNPNRVGSLGRFGVGELWSYFSDSEIAKLTKAGIRYQSLLHPQSGKPGRRQDLEKVLNEYQWESLFKKAADRTSRELENN